MNNPFTNKVQKVLKLYQQKEKFGKVVIGVDFDFTLYDSSKPLGEGEFYEDVLQLVLQAQESGVCELCLWTANPDVLAIIDLCLEEGLHFDQINSSTIFPDSDSRKPHFNLLLDDSAGLGESIEILQDFLEAVKD